MLLMRDFRGNAVLKRKGPDVHDAGLLGCSGGPVLKRRGPVAADARLPGLPY